MANNLEGGKTPQLPQAELQRMGFMLVAYPLSLLGVSLQAMRTALTAIADGGAQPESAMPSFEASTAAAASFAAHLGLRFINAEHVLPGAGHTTGSRVPGVLRNR